VAGAGIGEREPALEAEAVDHIGKCLDHPAWEIRKYAAELLSEFPTAAANALVCARMAREPIPEVKEALARAARIGPRASENDNDPEQPLRPTRPERLRREGRDS